MKSCVEHFSLWLNDDSNQKSDYSGLFFFKILDKPKGHWTCTLLISIAWALEMVFRWKFMKSCVEYFSLWLNIDWNDEEHSSKLFFFKILDKAMVHWTCTLLISISWALEMVFSIEIHEIMCRTLQSMTERWFQSKIRLFWAFFLQNTG